MSEEYLETEDRVTTAFSTMKIGEHFYAGALAGFEPKTKQPRARHNSNAPPRQAVACANLRYISFKILKGVFLMFFFAVALKIRLVFLYGRQLFFIELIIDVRPTIL